LSKFFSSLKLERDKTNLGDLDVRLAKILIWMVDNDKELLAFFFNTRYSVFFLNTFLLRYRDEGALSREQCLDIGAHLRSRTHRQQFIDESISRGFLEKEISKEDKRRVLISPTEKTLRLYAEWSNLYHDTRRATFGGE
jgi:hypothetical protein